MNLPVDVRAPLGLFETLGFDGAAWRFVDLHRARMAASAGAFGLGFDADAFDTALAAVETVPGTRLLARLDLGPTGRIAVRTRPWVLLLDPVRLVVTSVRVASHDERLRHKTTHRAPYDAALAEAYARGADDGLLVNEHGHVTEASRFTVFVRTPSGLLSTPPLTDGVLAGVLRQHLFDTGVAVEAPLRAEDLPGADVWVGNAARGLLRACLVA